MTEAELHYQAAATADELGFVRLPWAAVRGGDRIRLDAVAGTLDALVDAAEWAARAPATIGDGSYPLCRTMFLYTLGEPKPPVAAFLRWLASEPGQAVTRAAGYLPAR